VAIDVEVVDALAHGDRDTALQLLIREYGAAVASVCTRMMRDRARAEDVQQQVFVQAWHDLHTWEQRSSLRSWVLGIAHHRCLDAIKRHGREGKRFTALDIDPDDGSAAADPTARLDADMARRALDDCLQALEPRVRLAVWLRFHEGMSYEDLGRMYGEKADTLRTRVVRALHVLRTCLAQKGFGP
jgi:RNA polymerase sigma-70 factor (ECF subfamily)